MKRARFQVTHEMLAELLQLPKGIRIRRVVPPNEAIHHPLEIVLILEGDDLPVKDVRDGQIIQEVMAQIEIIPDESVSKWSMTFVEMPESS